MVQSRLRSPASTWATATVALAATRAAAMVEFTSPTTTTTSGRSCSTIGSSPVITAAVCWAWVPEPTPRWWSGARIPSSSKNTVLIDGS